jgi:hypothetical protein
MQDYLSMALVPLSCGASSQLCPGSRSLFVCESNNRITSPFKGLAHWEPDQSRSRLGHRLKHAQHSLELFGTVVRLATDGDYCDSCETSGLQLTPPTVLTLSLRYRCENGASFLSRFISCLLLGMVVASMIHTQYIRSTPCALYIVLTWLVENVPIRSPLDVVLGWLEWCRRC